MSTPSQQGPRPRLVGLDVARALAICFMVLENFKFYLVDSATAGPQWLVWLASLPDGRSAPLFVTLAGVGIALASSRAYRADDRQALSLVRSSLLRRSIFFLVAGNLLILVWFIDILHFYAVYTALAALFFLRASQRVLLIGTVAFIALATALLVVLPESIYEFGPYWTPLGVPRDTFLSGIHPVIPWQAFVLFGMWLARLELAQPQVYRALLRWAVLVAVGSELTSLALTRAVVNGAWPSIPVEALALFGTSMNTPAALYMVSALATSTAAIAACLALADRLRTSRVLTPIVAAGQLSLTLYIAHAIIGVGGLWLLGLVGNVSIPFMLAYWVGYVTLSVVAAHFWRRWFGRGPLEWLLRVVSSTASKPAAGVVIPQKQRTEAAPVPPHRALTVTAWSLSAIGVVLLFWWAAGGMAAQTPCGELSAELRPGQRTTGQLTMICPRRWYVIELAEERAVTISVTSGFDNYLELYPEQEPLPEEPLHEDDDSGTALNARLSSPALPVGRYRVLLRPYSDGTGPYVIEMQ